MSLSRVQNERITLRISCIVISFEKRANLVASVEYCDTNGHHIKSIYERITYRIKDLTIDLPFQVKPNEEKQGRMYLSASGFKEDPATASLVST